MAKQSQAIGRHGVYFESVLHLKNPKIVIPNMRIDQIQEYLEEYYRLDKKVRIGEPLGFSKYSDRVVGTFMEKEYSWIDENTKRIRYEMHFKGQSYHRPTVDKIVDYVNEQPNMEILVQGLSVSLIVFEERI